MKFLRQACLQDRQKAAPLAPRNAKQTQQKARIVTRLLAKAFFFWG
jgi:hypothetical protein